MIAWVELFNLVLMFSQDNLELKFLDFVFVLVVKDALKLNAPYSMLNLTTF